ncbi:MAG: DNA-binding response regulator [Phormidesmis priestleyi]|uniref:DNA-binding response regulator n=1 Tax=Phormidesmis priestleyi TaxID=268141 RepID=A0A2W4XHJ9_9CYAN|nr:MAG: DNA-binding response regulator [Phormidesmis priestleyi]
MQKILIVDDDNTLRTALTRYLKDLGFFVYSAASGTEGLDSFTQDAPDLIVSDIVMPEMNGFELCGKVRETALGQLVPFIFLSGRCDLADRIQGHSIGADDYLVKPFHPKELIAKIEAHLARAGRIHLQIENALKRSNYERSAITQAPLVLTPAEEKVFWEVVQGFTNKRIGDRLFISPRTVQTHLSNILSKLSLENRSQLIRYAFENGHIPSPDTDAGVLPSAGQSAGQSTSQSTSQGTGSTARKKTSRKAGK